VRRVADITLQSKIYTHLQKGTFKTMSTSSSAKRFGVLCLVLLLGVSVAASGAGWSSGSHNQTAKNGSTKQTSRRGSTAASRKQDDAALRARANRLHRQSIVIDTHNDITSPLIDDGFDLAMRGDDPNAKIKTHTDLRRMKAGGLAEFFAVYAGKNSSTKCLPKAGRGTAGARCNRCCARAGAPSS
jgi:hypothetical protein